MLGHAYRKHCTITQARIMKKYLSNPLQPLQYMTALASIYTTQSQSTSRLVPPRHLNFLVFTL